MNFMSQKLNKHLQSWADDRGYKTVLDVVYIPGDIPLSVINPEGLPNAFHIIASVDVSSATNQAIKSFSNACKPYGNCVFTKDSQTIAISFVAYGAAKIHNKLDAAVMGIFSAMQESGITYNSNCMYCSGSNCDTLVVAQKHFKCAHSSCVENDYQDKKVKIDDNRENGNYITGIVAAVIGAIVGAIPAILIMYLFNVISAWVYALIPLCATFAYKKANGIQNKLMPFVVSILSLVCAIFSYYFAQTISVKDYIAQNSSRTVGFAYAWKYVTSPAQASVVLPDAAKVVMFCIVGIVVAWKYMSSTNKSTLNDLKSVYDNQIRLS